MQEIWRPCEWGRVHQRASGLFLAVVAGPFGTEKKYVYSLCADCAFNQLYKHVRCVFDPKTDSLIFYHDVKKVDLLTSFVTDFVPPPEKTVRPSIAPLKVIKSRTPMKPLRLQFATDADFDPNPEWLR